jgi:branched-subunit amino acid ABC-type transport system permease component
MDHHERTSASTKTAEVLLLAFAAYLLGGFTSVWATIIGSAVVAVGLFMVIRDFWKAAATPRCST